MPLSPELKAKITDTALLSEIENEILDVESRLSDTTKESISRKQKLREYESKHAILKKYGLDPDGDWDEQLETFKTKAKDGTKPVSDFDKMTKKLTDLENKIAEKEQRAIMAETRSAFLPKIKDHFGKAAEDVLELATLKGLIASKDGIAGIMVDDEFTPLNMEKGTSAIDVLKKLYPHHVVINQKSGSHNVNTNTSLDNSQSETIDRSTFEQLPFAEKMEMMKKNVELVD
jgi:hypothetical protein